MVIVTGREIYSFRTPDPAAKSCKAFVTSRLDGKANYLLDPMIERCKAQDADLFCLLGDDVAKSPADAFRYFLMVGYLNDVVRKWGKTKPTVFLRGEREMDGWSAFAYGNYFPRPDGKMYYTVSMGPVLFICLDTIGCPEENLQREQYAAYLKEQADWLIALKGTQAWKDAKFRVVLTHVAPLNGTPASKMVAKAFQTAFSNTLPAGSRSCFSRLFKKASSDGRIHLIIAGHESLYSRIESGSAGIIYGNRDFADAVIPRAASKYYSGLLKTIPQGVDYTLVICRAAEGMTIEAAPDKLSVKSHRWDMADGGFTDAFEITPDGKNVQQTAPLTIYGKEAR